MFWNRNKELYKGSEILETIGTNPKSKESMADLIRRNSVEDVFCIYSNIANGGISDGPKEDYEIMKAILNSYEKFMDNFTEKEYKEMLMNQNWFSSTLADEIVSDDRVEAKKNEILVYECLRNSIELYQVSYESPMPREAFSEEGLKIYLDYQFNNMKPDERWYKIFPEFEYYDQKNIQRYNYVKILDAYKDPFIYMTNYTFPEAMDRALDEVREEHIDREVHREFESLKNNIEQDRCELEEFYEEHKSEIDGVER